MEHVMVPVPVEIEDAVRLFLMETDMRGRSEIKTEISRELVISLLPTLNARCREALTVLAAQTVAAEPPTIGELIRTLEWTEHETVGVLHELSELIWEAFGPRLALVPTAPTDATAGSVNWDHRKVILWRDLALAVVDVEAEVASRP